MLTVLNNMATDGVVFCIAHPYSQVFLDKGLTVNVVGSKVDCSIPGDASTTWGLCNPTTLAFGLPRGQSASIWVAPGGTINSGVCWYQDVDSNKRKSLSKGMLYQSQAEFTVLTKLVSYDITSVEGLSGGLVMTYTDDAMHVSSAECLPNAPVGNQLQIVSAEDVGFPTILSDKNQPSVPGGPPPSEECVCTVYHPDDPACNTPACYAACPSVLGDNPCGQHRCRKFYAEQYANPFSFCGWLQAEFAQAYCWAFDEYRCVDILCGYGGPSEPADSCADVETFDQAKKLPNIYSCGMDTIQGPAGMWWPDGPKCFPKSVKNVPTNPIPERYGGVLEIEFRDLPWLRLPSKSHRESQYQDRQALL